MTVFLLQGDAGPTGPRGLDGKNGEPVSGPLDIQALRIFQQSKRNSVSPCGHVMFC